MDSEFKYIYGPVYSWRLGMSLGIDPLSDKHKICNYDCIYCQLGKTVYFENERREFVFVDEILKEINALPPLEAIDYFTFSGRGEPTLAKNLGQMIQALKELNRAKIAVITNSSLIDQKDVRADLMMADYVLAKMDAYDQKSFGAVDKPEHGIDFDNSVKSLAQFSEEYKGKLALQIMFVKENERCAAQIAERARGIQVDEIQINTPLRPSAAQSLSEEELNRVKTNFIGMPAVTVYEKERKTVDPMNDRDTIKRHGNFKTQVKGVHNEKDD